MLKIEYAKVAYLFDGVTNGILTDDAAKVIHSLLKTENLYLSATREIATKLENLNDEFKYGKDHNPIHEIKTRVKSPKSIMDKLVRGGFDLSVESARENLTDIAGVRVICSYIDTFTSLQNFLNRMMILM